MTIRVSPTGTRGARVPKRGPLWKLFQLVGKRQVKTYRGGGEERVSKKMGFPVVPSAGHALRRPQPPRVVDRLPTPALNPQSLDSG